MLKAIGKRILVSSLSRRLWGVHKFDGSILILCGYFDIYFVYRKGFPKDD